MLWIQVYDLILGIGVIILQIAIVALLVVRIAYARGYVKRIGDGIIAYGVPIAFVTALLAMIGSMVYSAGVGFEPCLFCWWQRIFLFPQVFILGIATFTKERQSIKKYALILSGIGLCISIYHYLIQNSTKLAESAACNVIGQSASCSGAWVHVFNYITIPMMCLTIFAMIIVLLSFMRKKN